MKELAASCDSVRVLLFFFLSVYSLFRSGFLMSLLRVLSVHRLTELYGMAECEQRLPQNLTICERSAYSNP